MKTYLKNISIKIELQVFKDQLAETKYDMENIHEAIQDLIEGDFELKYSLPRTPFLFMDYQIHEIDKEWTQV